MHSAVLKGRKHPSYQVFAAQIKLPEIRGGESEVIILGEEAFTFRVGEEPSAEQKAALCDALKLPPPALSAILKDLPPQANGSMVASQFKTALIDYFYLLERWNAYRPGPGKEEVKLHALKELEEGNLAQAWLQYSLLPKPAPPGSSLGPATTP